MADNWLFLGITAATVVDAFLYILPAYVTIVAAAIFGGGKPIDLGKTFFDGRRVLGDGKTFRGFFAGLAAGLCCGAALGNTTLGLFLSLGALVGDIIAAFFKRRIGLERGAPAPGLDQLDFLAGALLLGCFVQPPTIDTVFITVVITPLLHLTVNLLGHLLGLKAVPW